MMYGPGVVCYRHLSGTVFHRTKIFPGIDIDPAYFLNGSFPRIVTMRDKQVRDTLDNRNAVLVFIHDAEFKAIVELHNLPQKTPSPAPSPFQALPPPAPWPAPP